MLVKKPFKDERELRKELFLPALRVYGYAEYLETPFDKGRSDIVFFYAKKPWLIELKHVQFKPKVKGVYGPPKYDQVLKMTTDLQQLYLNDNSKYKNMIPLVVCAWYEPTIDGKFKIFLSCIDFRTKMGILNHFETIDHLIDFYA